MNTQVCLFLNLFYMIVLYIKGTGTFSYRQNYIFYVAFILLLFLFHPLNLSAFNWIFLRKIYNWPYPEVQFPKENERTLWAN